MTELQVLKDNIRVLLKLEHGNDIYIESDWKLLWYLVDNDKVDLLKDLIKNGVDIDIKDYDGETLLIWSCYSGTLRRVRILLELGADPNIQSKYNSTALIKTSIYNHIELTELLLKNMADPNIKNATDHTALDYAKYDNHPEIIELLKKYGAKE